MRVKLRTGRSWKTEKVKPLGEDKMECYAILYIIISLVPKQGLGRRKFFICLPQWLANLKARKWSILKPDFQHCIWHNSEFFTHQVQVGEKSSGNAQTTGPEKTGIIVVFWPAKCNSCERIHMATRFNIYFVILNKK